MYYPKIKKSIAFILAIALTVSVAMTGVIASAADTTTQTAPSGEPPSGGGPSGEPPSGEPPSGGRPSGEVASSGAISGQPPSGGAPSSQAPTGSGSSGQAPSGQAPSGGASSGQAKSGVGPSGEPPSGGKGGANTMTYDYTGNYTGALMADGTLVTSDKESYTASTADQNAALVQNGGTLKILNGTFTKSGDDTNGDNCNFYGVNSILLAVNEDSTAYISGSSLSADSEGSNGIFATDKATIYANDNTISTTAANSRGLDATYGGTILANLMKIFTKGDHSAAIATDRGGGKISATNSTLSTAGSGSPLLYSTGDIEVDKVTGTATGSQIAGMEGLNTILIYNSNLESTITDKTASDPIANGVIIYQSTSGDAESTTGDTATFEVSNSTLKSAITNGTMFYVTNTKANIVLSDTVLDFDSSKVNLMTIQGNDANNWGTAGSNGAEVQFTGLGETLSGNIDVDSISSLNMYLLKGTAYTGTTTISTNAVNTKATATPITINLDSTSKWVLTGDATVSDLNAEDGATIVDEDGNKVSIVANGKTVVKGTSDYTITVTGSYSTTVTTDSSNQLSTDYIDRSAFDEYYGVVTTFGENGTAAAEANASVAKEDSNVMMYFIIAVVCAILAGGVTIRYKKRQKTVH